MDNNMIKIGRKTYYVNPVTGEKALVKPEQKISRTLRKLSSPRKNWKKVVMYH